MISLSLTLTLTHAFTFTLTMSFTQFSVSVQRIGFNVNAADNTAIKAVNSQEWVWWSVCNV